MATSTPTPAQPDAAPRKAMICTGCAAVIHRGRQIRNGLLAAVGWFLFVPAVAVVLGLVAGPDVVSGNSLFLGGAWLVLGMPAAGSALRKGFSRACPECGSADVVALDSPDGRRVETTGAMTPTLHTGRVTALTALPDGRLASGAKDGTIRVWTTSRDDPPVVLTGHEGQVTALATTPEGKLVSAADDHTVRVWDLDDAKPVVLTGYEDTIIALATLPDGRVVSGDQEGVLLVRDPKRPDDPGVTHTFAGALATLPDGRVAAAHSDSSLEIWDPAGAAEPQTLPLGESTINALAVLPDGRLATGEKVFFPDAPPTGLIRIVDLAEGTPFTIEVPGPIESLVALPDGRLAATYGMGAGMAGKVNVWDLGDDGTATPMVLPDIVAKTLVPLPDGRLATAGWSDDEVRVSRLSHTAA